MRCYETKNFLFMYREEVGNVYVEFIVLDSNSCGANSGGAELVEENFAMGMTNPCYGDGTPLDFSEFLWRLDRANDECRLNIILLEVYWTFRKFSWEGF